MQKLSDLSPEQRLDLGDRLRAMPDDEKREFLESLNEQQRLDILYDPILHMRKKQWVAPDEKKNITLLLCGRGWY